MFIVITYYKPSTGKQPVVHAWGPYESRVAAESSRKRFQRSEKEAIDAGKFTVHISQLTDDRISKSVLTRSGDR